MSRRGSERLASLASVEICTYVTWGNGGIGQDSSYGRTVVTVFRVYSSDRNRQKFKRPRETEIDRIHSLCLLSDYLGCCIDVSMRTPT
jgi:hypothetical protein